MKKVVRSSKVCNRSFLTRHNRDGFLKDHSKALEATCLLEKFQGSNFEIGAPTKPQSNLPNNKKQATIFLIFNHNLLQGKHFYLEMYRKIVLTKNAYFATRIMNRCPELLLYLAKNRSSSSLANKLAFSLSHF